MGDLRIDGILPLPLPSIHKIIGTPGFVAPEIANLQDKESPYSSICDMFSVGVILHIL